MKYTTAHCVLGNQTCCIWNNNMHSEDSSHPGYDAVLSGEYSHCSFRNQLTEQQSVIIPEDTIPQKHCK